MGIDHSVKKHFHKWKRLILWALVIMVAVFFRFDQILNQVLISDEWHSLHLILNSTTEKIFKTFGKADHGIPMTLFYQWLSQNFILSEIVMRAPMLVAGVLTVILLPVYMARKHNQNVALIFAFLLSISPVLIYYSRMARPYSISVLLVFISHYLFYKLLKQRFNFKLIMLYVLVSVLATWLHLVVAIVVATPVLIELVRMVVRKDYVHLKKVFSVILLALIFGAMLLLPPLMNSFGSLSAKTGGGGLELSTLGIVWFNWVGTDSLPLLLASMLLMVWGFKSLWLKFDVFRSLCVGLLLTAILIIFLQPDYLHIPTTFGRYLLVIVPLILLSISQAVWLLFKKAKSAEMTIPFLALMAVYFAALIYSNPLWKTLKYPNDHSLHTVYKLAYPEKYNAHRAFQQEHIPLSNFWQKMSRFEAGEYTLAVSPWHFSAVFWDGVRWQEQSRQHIMPAYFTGFCEKQRHGEVPLDSRIQLRNKVHLVSSEELVSKEVDLIVYQKPYLMSLKGRQKLIGEEFSHCEAKIRKQFKEIVFEDDRIAVFAISPKGKELKHVKW